MGLATEFTKIVSTIKDLVIWVQQNTIGLYDIAFLRSGR